MPLRFSWVGKHRTHLIGIAFVGLVAHQLGALINGRSPEMVLVQTLLGVLRLPIAWGSSS
jgi:hypothetical protein